MRPVIHSPVPHAEEGDGSHLADCAYCGVANGITAHTCWRCGAEAWRHRPEGRARNAAASALKEASRLAHASPLPALSVPPPLRPSLVTLPTLEIEADDEELRDFALAHRASEAPLVELPNERSTRARQQMQPLRTRGVAAVFGGLAVVILLAGLMLKDRYQSNLVGAGWTPVARHEEALAAAPAVAGPPAPSVAAAPTAFQANDVLEQAPPAAGPAPVNRSVSAPPAAAPSQAALPPPPTAELTRSLGLEAGDLRRAAAAPPAFASSAASSPWACTEGVAALGLCSLPSASTKP